MLLWLRFRRTPAVAVAVAVVGLGSAAGSGHVIDVPTLIGGGSQPLLVGTFLPLILAASVGYSLSTVAHQVEYRATPWLARLDAALVLAIIASSAVVLSVTDPDNSSRAIAHCSILVGVVLIFSRTLGTNWAVFSATALMLTTSSYSAHLKGASYVRVLQPDGDEGIAIALAVIMLTIGLVLLVVDRRPSSSA